MTTLNLGEVSSESVTHSVIQMGRMKTKYEVIIASNRMANFKANAAGELSLL